MERKGIDPSTSALRRLGLWVNGVRPRPARPTSPQVHSIEDIARVLDLLASRSATWCGGRLFVLAATVAYTGLRRDECLCLSTDAVRLTDGLLDVQDRRRLKTVESAAPVPIPPPLTPILRTGLPLLQRTRR